MLAVEAEDLRERVHALEKLRVRSEAASVQRGTGTIDVPAGAESMQTGGGLRRSG